MFGKGVYFADMSSKSANYCCAEDSGGKGLLLLSEVALGPLYEVYGGDYYARENARKRGKLSTLGKGQVIHSEWKDARSVHPDLKGVGMPNGAAGYNVAQASLMYNEYIVYDVSQIRLRYLFFLDIHKRPF
jgi:poly [ADP-ribose] polymerase